ncbi:unnamed protein product [Cuscuta campestris]|uniref:Retrovirus-related Pol polyprotein from transposon TNT 1-94-like beta-barrel domain-containing protein n=1 Tax=Cuscuta campestris TaxID=132261 RepID=A0A484NEF5_9ASTE|nr:unnamed protein product [Cuscuta campestris]
MMKFKLYYCYRLYLIVGPERLQQLPVQWDPMNSPLIRFEISFLARMSEERVHGSHLVNCFMLVEAEDITEVVGAGTDKGQSASEHCRVHIARPSRSSIPGEALQNLDIRDFGKVRLADDKALDVTGMGDIVLKTPVGFWTLKDVKVVPALKKSLISVRQLDEQGHEVKFRDGQWKVMKGNLVMARGRKRGSLYMVELPSEGVTVPVQKKNEVRFTESRGQNKVVCAREKPRAIGHTQDERAWKGSRRLVKGICGSGSSRCASAKLPRRQWVRRTSIPAVGTSPENFLLSTEIVCSQDVPGSGSVRLQWEPVGTKDESGADFAVTDVLELRRASTGLSVV